MTSSNTKRLYIGNLEPSVDEYAIVKLFEPHGKITFLDYMFHWSGPKKGQPRGYCFLEYDKKQNALNAMSALHGKVVKGRPLVVRFAHQSSEHDERRNHKSSSLAANRPSSFAILRSQKMSNASTDAKIQAIERKLATLQNNASPPPTDVSSSTAINTKPSSSSSSSPSTSSSLQSKHTYSTSSLSSSETKKNYIVKPIVKNSSASTSTTSNRESSSTNRRYNPY
ncbi:hypothetical protein INT45_008963 [Circinella minor]|uniref:Probable RNA-binding protein 18 n=1 Tax=Circinella minor TaxID=1195481 RepID=A0A8H7S823_9FUNG|nr:hypothetical protein INT45_008963 [Circinella minor]